MGHGYKEEVRDEYVAHPTPNSQGAKSSEVGHLALRI